MIGIPDVLVEWVSDFRLDQPAGEEDTRASLWVRLGEMCDDGLGDDFIPRAANRRHARRQEEGQNFVSRDVGIVDAMDEMHVGVDQAGDDVFVSPVDHLRPVGVCVPAAGRLDGFDSAVRDNQGLTGDHLLRHGVEDRGVLNDEGPLGGIRYGCTVQADRRQKRKKPVPFHGSCLPGAFYGAAGGSIRTAAVRMAGTGLTRRKAGGSVIRKLGRMNSQKTPLAL